MPVEGVVFLLDSELPPEAKSLLQDFRLAVNCGIGAGLQARVTSRNALSELAYRSFRVDFQNMHSQHLTPSFEVAASAPTPILAAQPLADHAPAVPG